MRSLLACFALAVLPALATTAGAHGALAVNELEVLAISDFEGQEESFPWEGFEIWDVYVGDGYSLAHDADGVYFKVNFAGNGTLRPTGSAAWTIDISFKVGDEAFARTLSHDGAEVTTTFEELEWSVADGNVFQIRAWVPVADATGKAVSDIVVLSSVDGDPRDVAPGGVFDPATGTEHAVQAPATPVFPALGQGRIVEQVPITGPQKWLDVTVAPQGAGVFQFTVKNPLAEQGQHVLLREVADATWTMSAAATSASLDGAASATFVVTLAHTATSGVVEPVPVDFHSDIGGRRTYYAYLEGEEIMLTEDAGAAHATALEEPKEESPGPGPVALVAALALALVALRTPRRRA